METQLVTPQELAGAFKVISDLRLFNDAIHFVEPVVKQAFKEIDENMNQVELVKFFLDTLREFSESGHNGRIVLIGNKYAFDAKTV